MVRTVFVLFVAVFGASAQEVRTLTLRQAIDLALEQNPDLAIARLDEQKAEHSVQIARDAFVPKVVAGSGLAYSSGFPMSIEGATPSIVQARAVSYVFNRPQSYKIASAKEARRGAALDLQAKREDVAYRTAELFLDAERNAKSAETTKREIESLEKVAGTVKARVDEGRELPIENKRAALNLARAKYRLQTLETARATIEATLSSALGLEGEAVRVAVEDRTPPPIPLTEDAAVEAALTNSKELRVMESRLFAKTLDARGERSARLPRVDLVAQYALLARFNNYDEFFRKFQRHNGQLGVSFQIPLWSGPGIHAAASQEEAEAAKMRIEIRNARNRIAADTRRAYREIKESEAAVDVARLDLEVARDELSVLLAQNQEGRASLAQIEDARFSEAEKWIAFYDSAAAGEKARLFLLRQTGTLASELR